MRALLHAAAGAALALPAAVLAAAPAAAAPGATDVVLQAQTAATAVHLTLTQEPASSIITQSLVDDAAAYTAGAFDSEGGSDAQAAPLYPGKLVVQGPALFCSQLFPCPAAPPDYPLLADASYPRRTHASASTDQGPVGSGPLVVTPAGATATATDSGNHSRTSSSGLSLLSGTPVAATVGASSAASSVVTKSGRLLVHVESAVTGIDIAGLLHIASVRSTDDVTVRAALKPVDRPHIVVSGVTVAGNAATVDDDGVHVAGHDGPALAQQLSRLGVSVRVVGTDRDDRIALARSSATALEVSFSTPVSGAPYVPNPLASQQPFDNIPGVNANGTYVGRITFGAVGAVAGANAQPTFDLGGVFPLGGSSSPTSPAPAAAGAATTGAPGTSTGAAPVAAQPPAVAGIQHLLRGFLDGVTTDLATLYAALALGTAALFIGWRGAILWRQRRATAGRGG